MPNRLALLSQRFCGVCHVLHLLLPLRAVLVCKQADHVGIRDELTQHAQPLGAVVPVILRRLPRLAFALALAGCFGLQAGRSRRHQGRADAACPTAWLCCPNDFAASATSCICSCPCGLFWFASRPLITSASGTS